jgi:hypothetical protein
MLYTAFQCLEKVIKLIAKITKNGGNRNNLKEGDMKVAMTLHVQRTAEKNIELSLARKHFR